MSTSQVSYPPQPTYPVSYDEPKVEPVDYSTSTSPSTAASKNISNLFSALLKAGVVSASGTPTGAGTTVKEQTPPSTDTSKDVSRDYRRAILSTKIQLNSADITRCAHMFVDRTALSNVNGPRQRPPIVRFLYDMLSSQCKQCGIRFSDSSLGKKRMEDHLDMHFRQNRKTTQGAGRGHSRGWFIGAEVC